jgi:hypothetical protein
MTTMAPRLADLDVDPKAVGRWARDLQIPDVAEMARNVDVPRRLDAGLSVASAAVRGAMEQLPSQRRRRRRRSFLLGGVLVTLLAVAGLAATWWMRRMSVAGTLEDELKFDREALDRAVDDGAPIAIDADLATDRGTIGA